MPPLYRIKRGKAVWPFAEPDRVDRPMPASHHATCGRLRFQRGSCRPPSSRFLCGVRKGRRLVAAKDLVRADSTR
jgi:hypothetical protein